MTKRTTLDLYEAYQQFTARFAQCKVSHILDSPWNLKVMHGQMWLETQGRTRLLRKFYDNIHELGIILYSSHIFDGDPWSKLGQRC